MNSTSKMKAPTAFLERYTDIKVNLSKLLAEYLNIQDQLHDVVNHGNKVLVQKKYNILKCNEWHQDKDNFPYTLEIAEQIKKIFDFNSITYRSVQPNTAYNWHTDIGQLCYHVPLITNPGCWFVYEHRSFSMPADGSVYLVNNGRPHTFVNAGSTPRIHLTFEILD
jgi:hypothetical protein